jgi:hypothetical protein
MNQTIEDFARAEIIKQCESLPTANQRIFRLRHSDKRTSGLSYTTQPR